MMKNLRTLTAALLFVSWLTMGAYCQEVGGPPAISKAQWREDLKFFDGELAKRHKNLYHAVSKEQFETSVAKLDADISSLAEHQIIVRMIQIAAMVGDGHTGVRVPAYFRFYPLNVYWFGKELRVIAAGKEYESVLGTRVVKIGDLSIDEVQTRVRTCFPSADNENDWYVMSTSPSFIIRPEVLNGLGIVPDVERAQVTFEDDLGKRSTLELRPVLGVPVGHGNVSIPGLVPAVSSPPLFRQRPTERFWFVDLPDSQTVYVNFRGYDSLGDNAAKLFKLVDETKPKRLVIDMRQNGGGDFFQGRKHLIQAVKDRPEINQKGRLFILIGRRTFSAALANAIDFRKDTNAILVGEPIGERPNSYSENNEITLPNSHLVVSYSSTYYRFLDEDVPAVMPDQRIDPTWSDFKAGRDAVMDWVMSQKP